LSITHGLALVAHPHAVLPVLLVFDQSHRAMTHHPSMIGRTKGAGILRCHLPLISLGSGLIRLFQ
jgi:hypothetical protein